MKNFPGPPVYSSRSEEGGAHRAHQFVGAIAFTNVLIKKTVNGGFTAGMKLTQEELIEISTFDVSTVLTDEDDVVL